MLLPFQDAMRSFGLSPGSAPVFLAISGGMDSVVLAHLLKAAGYQATWLHMNFQLRGAESERDALFVGELAEQWNQPVVIKKVDAAQFAADQKCAIQEAARTLRYRWFSEVVLGAGKQAVLLTAHQADDNAETMLMHFLRGTGLRGLTGIPPVNKYIRRPLIGITRAEIQAYQQAHALAFVEDSSNQTTDYTRNQLRLEVMPVLRSLYPQVDQNLQQNIGRFRSAYAIYSDAVQRWIRKYVSVQNGEQRVSCALLLQASNRAMIHEWLVPYGFTEKQETELIRLGGSQSGHFMVSADGSYQVIKHRKHFILAPVSTEDPGSCWIGEGLSELEFPAGKLRILQGGAVPEQIPTNAAIALLDARELVYPLVLRKWRAGDYFYPLGLNKKKKLARFLIDQKVSKVQKERVWVIESAGRIVWVVGHRIDHRFRVNETSASLLRIDFAPQL